MSDTNSFINAYIDNAVGMIHENISSILQFKTQLKVSNDLVAQKDLVIKQLTDQIEQLNNTNSELSQLRSQNTVLQEKNHALANKASHLDSLLNQVNEMKLMIQQRDSRIAELETKIDDKTVQLTESALNTKSKKITKLSTVTSNTSSSSLKAETDDF